MHRSGRRRHTDPGHARLPARRPIGRHRAVPAVRLRRLRGPDRCRSSTAACRPCSTAGSSTRSPTSAAAARAGGSGGCRAGCDSKPTTFTDYLAVADRLAGAGGPRSSTASRIVSRGASAGGLLQGAVYSMRPDRWRAVVAEVPFVDCVNDDARRLDPADRERVGGMGRPARPDDYACMPLILALRKSALRPAAGDAGHRRGARPEGRRSTSPPSGSRNCGRPTARTRSCCSGPCWVSARTAGRRAAARSSATRARSRPSSSTRSGSRPASVGGDQDTAAPGAPAASMSSGS